MQSPVSNLRSNSPSNFVTSSHHQQHHHYQGGGGGGGGGSTGPTPLAPPPSSSSYHQHHHASYSPPSALGAGPPLATPPSSSRPLVDPFSIPQGDVLANAFRQFLAAMKTVLGDPRLTDMLSDSKGTYMYGNPTDLQASPLITAVDTDDDEYSKLIAKFEEEEKQLKERKQRAIEDYRRRRSNPSSGAARPSKTSATGSVPIEEHDTFQMERESDASSGASVGPTPIPGSTVSLVPVPAAFAPDTADGSGKPSPPMTNERRMSSFEPQQCTNLPGTTSSGTATAQSQTDAYPS